MDTTLHVKAQFLLPVPIDLLAKLTGPLQAAYGDGLVMRTDDRWLYIGAPVPAAAMAGG